MSLTPLGARGQVGYGLGVTGVSGFTPSDVTQAEADALIALYDATGGDDWTRSNAGWKTDPIVGNWYGVTVSGGHVTRVRLWQNNLTGFSEEWDGLDLSLLTLLHLYDNSITDISGITWPDSLETLYLHDNSITDISETWPDSLTKLQLASNSITDISEVTWPDSLTDLNLGGNSITDISEVTWPNSLTTLILFGNSITDILGVTWPDSLADLRIQNSSMSQANVDLLLSQIYDQRMGFTDASPYGYIGGTNAEPSGIYQYAAAPSTGKEYMYALENDDDGEGFSIWDFDLDYS